MIFVTVGTHEQQFNRLIKEIDYLKQKKIICEEVFIQSGFSTYIPKYCKYKNFLSYADMIDNVKNSRIVITHGGPSSFILPVQFGKIPIVVPRQQRFDEHINNHQVDFSLTIEKRLHNIIVVENISELEKKIAEYSSIQENSAFQFISNNSCFCNSLSDIVKKMM